MLPRERSWKELYVAALFESDINNLAKRIEIAEEALAARSRELFHAAGDNVEEEEALDNAMYALRALRSAYRCSTSTPGSDSA